MWRGVVLAAVLGLAALLPAQAQAILGQPQLPTVPEAVTTGTSTLTEAACPTTVEQSFPTTTTTSDCAGVVRCERSYTSHTSNFVSDDECRIAAGSASVDCAHYEYGGNGYHGLDDHCYVNGQEVCSETSEDWPGSPEEQQCTVGGVQEYCVDEPVDYWAGTGEYRSVCGVKAAGVSCSAGILSAYGEIKGVDTANTGCRRDP